MIIRIRKGNGTTIEAPDGATSAVIPFNNENLEIEYNKDTGFIITPNITSKFQTSTKNREIKTKVVFDNNVEYDLYILHN